MSNETFKIGEIATLVYSRGPYLTAGDEVEVIGGLAPRAMFSGAIETGYRVYSARSCDPVSKVCPTGRYLCVLPDQLRKRRPPQDWVKLCNLSDVPGEVANV